ncbi:MAG: pyridoxal-phosphate dependent enzyme, partial [Halalkalicoccus sp.]
MPTVRCYDCGRSVPFGERARCVCGESLWFELGEVEWPDRHDPGMWRYSNVLPADPPTGIGAAAGGTPLVRAPNLDVGGVRLFLKDEGQNPTGSFKDRGSALALAFARENGIERIGTVSHGNMAMSTAACAAAAGIDCTVCVPADISEERLANIARYDPDILRIEGDYGRLYHESLAIEGIRFVNSDTPLRVAGQKTTAYEICEAFSPSVPDAIVLPV